jgi:hypothetical protein
MSEALHNFGLPDFSLVTDVAYFLGYDYKLLAWLEIRRNVNTVIFIYDKISRFWVYLKFVRLSLFL